MLLAGGQEKPRLQCARNNCRKIFTPKRAGQTFCTRRCTTAAASEAYRRKKKPVREWDKRCKQCHEEFHVSSTMNPIPDFCCSNCQRHYNVRRTRLRNKLLDLGWWRSEEGRERWTSPEGREMTLDAAVKQAGLRKKVPLHQVDYDGVTVWVNGVDGLLGRFGVNGIDIHRPVREQYAGGECLHCTHAPTTKEDWFVFVRKMLEHYGIDLTHSKYMPRRFKSHGRRNKTTVPEDARPNARAVG